MPTRHVAAKAWWDLCCIAKGPSATHSCVRTFAQVQKHLVDTAVHLGGRVEMVRPNRVGVFDGRLGNYKVAAMR